MSAIPPLLQLDENRFFYWNPTTNQPSASTLSLRQLCRILCTSADKKTTISILQPDSALLLGYDSVTGEFSSQGWLPPTSIPILREACADWYYCEESNDSTVGPITCRALAEQFTTVLPNRIKLRVWSPQLSAISSNSTQNPTQTNTIDSSLQIYSTWNEIDKLPYLQAALEALQKVIMPSLSEWDAIQNSSDQTEQINNHDDINNDNNDGDDDEEQYQSDGGTVYIRCRAVGIDDWVPLSTSTTQNNVITHSSASSTTQHSNPPHLPPSQTKQKKNVGPKFKAKYAKNWIYITGLPTDAQEDEVAAYFAKVGILALDPETQKPKVKIYKSLDAKCKGDASVCYARHESVELALQLLDESHFRPPNNNQPSTILSVQRAKFEKHDEDSSSMKFKDKQRISNKKRKIARLAAIQATDWNEGDSNTRIVGGIQGLRIIVLKHMFIPHSMSDEDYEQLEKELYATCRELGTVEKITVFSQNPQGIVIIKFSSPSVATSAIQTFHGQKRGGDVSVEASYWDGVTDYTTTQNESVLLTTIGDNNVGQVVEEEKRLDDFGEWLDNQHDLPEEFKLQVGS